MGLVYTGEQVKSSLVPDEGAHYEVAMAIMSKLGTSYENYGISCMIHGSVAEGRAGVRSDLDLIVRYPADINIIALNSLIRRLTDDRHVYLESLFVSDEDAKGCLHRIDRPYYEHLVFSRDDPKQADFVLGDPLEGITADFRLSPEKVLGRYVFAKKTKFLRANTLAMDLKDLQRALELPAAINRKFVRLYKRNLVEVLDSKNSQEAEIVKVAFEGLVALDAEYSNLLNATLRGNIEIGQYQAALHDIQHRAIEHAQILTAHVMLAIYK